MRLLFQNRVADEALNDTVIFFKNNADEAFNAEEKTEAMKC
jgi:hypothetical protein